MVIVTPTWTPTQYERDEIVNFPEKYMAFVKRYAFDRTPDAGEVQEDGVSHRWMEQNMTIEGDWGEVSEPWQIIYGQIGPGYGNKKGGR